MKREIENIKHTIDDIIRVVLYLRLSKEDLDKLTLEERSESIKNQELMLKEYAKVQGWRVVGVYEDEDFSGADRDRPNFNKMIKECREGNVDIVLVKTQARFARDIELIDKYVHNLFKEWDVRFVTYIERIDNTKYETKKTSQITAMKDEWMLEDTSINIRETFKSKRMKGQFTGSFAPYGYMKDPENKNHLLIDPVVTDNVIRIFEEYNKGYGMDKIANGLSNDHILSPLEYKLFNGSNLKLPIIKEYTHYKNINKAGTFMIRVDYQNNERQILRNLTTVEILSDNILFNNILDISLNKVKNEQIKLFYTTKSLEEIDIQVIDKKLYYKNNFNFTDESTWIPINTNKVLPKNITCIVSNIERLDRTHKIFYEFEVTLKENRKHISYFYSIYPTVNNQNTNINYKIQIRNKHKWSSSTIRKILKDEIYIGNLVQFKTTTVSYKNHTIIYNDKDKQIKAENTHEPTIKLDLWYAVQKRLLQTKKSGKDGKVHILSNKVYCKECCKVFCKCGKKDKNGMAYLCCRDKVTKWSNCNNRKYIKEVELQEYIKDKINILLKRFYDENQQYKLNNDMIENYLFKDEISNLSKEKEKINRELKNKHLYFQNLYEDLKKSLLDEEQYISLRDKYKEDYNKLEDRLKTIKSSLFIIKKKQDQLKNKKDLFKKYRHIDELDIEIVNDFIDRIVIGKLDEKTNERKIHIVWNFTN